MRKYRQVVKEFSEHIEADSKGLLIEDVTRFTMASLSAFSTGMAEIGMNGQRN